MRHPEVVSTPVNHPLLLAALLTGPALAADWPDFRGPTSDGQAPAGSKLPVSWSETEHVAWKTAIPGKGWSTPVIWGEQLWLTTATEDGKEQSVLCLERLTGKILHQELLFRNPAPAPLGNDRNTYASPSPVIEEGRVYLHFGSYGTACLDTKTFATLWSRRDLPCDHYRGPASSPVLHGNLLILTFDGADRQYLEALDKATGKTVWHRQRGTNYGDLTPDGTPERDGDMRKAFNTPVFVRGEGFVWMISPGAKAAWAYDPLTGNEIWSVHWKEHSSASRTLFDRDRIYLNTGYGKSELWALRLDPQAKGELSASHVVWKNAKRMPNRCSPVIVGDRLYALSDQGVLSCLNRATGEEIWAERISEMPFSASLLAAGDLVYLFDEGGKGLVIRDGTTFRKVGENRLAAGLFASPATDGTALYLRTTTHVYRIAD
jgi:outer membrane protein assembly factor BamB